MEQDLKKYYPQDYVMKYTIIPLIPKFITPNQITVIRFIFTPIVLYLLLIENYNIGIPLFLLTAFTDVIDGSLARIRNQITKWGIVYDPIADKLLIGLVSFLFIAKYLPIYLALIWLFIEIIHLGVVTYIKKKGKLLAANVFGKIKMLLQVISATLVMIGVWLGNFNLVNFAPYLLITSFALALASLLNNWILFKKTK